MSSLYEDFPSHPQAISKRKEFSHAPQKQQKHRSSRLPSICSHALSLLRPCSKCISLQDMPTLPCICHRSRAYLFAPQYVHGAASPYSPDIVRQPYICALNLPFFCLSPQLDCNFTYLRNPCCPNRVPAC